MVFPTVFNLTNLNGKNGFRISADLAGGYSVSGAGDINADNIDDIIIGAPGANGVGQGYVIYGSKYEFPAIIDSIWFNGQNGFSIIGDESTELVIGSSVSGIGDINADGIDDIIISAESLANSRPGLNYVVFGHKFFPAEFNLSSINGQNGFVINDINGKPNSYYGHCVSGAGDVNLDGIDDMILGARDAGIYSDGQSYVIFGTSSGFISPFNLSVLNGQNGFAFNGGGIEEYLGWSVNGAGDINADGIDDIIIGAPFASPSGNSQAGKSYVVFGSKYEFPAIINSTWLNGQNGFIINGIRIMKDPGTHSGSSLSGAGDINADGIDDIIIGAPGCDDKCDEHLFPSGHAYIVFGAKSGFSVEFNLTSLNGQNGFVVNGAVPTGNTGDQNGYSVSGAGDINFDGVDDIIICAPGSNSVGQSYVIYGSRNLFPAVINVTELNGQNGFAIVGDYAAFSDGGCSVSDAGDINADGIDDIIIGAYWWGDFSDAYVIFGQNSSQLDSDLGV